MIEGTYTPASGTPRPVKGRLKGSVIALSIGDVEYEGTVSGNIIEGAPKFPPGAPKIIATRVE